MLQAVMYICK